MSGQQAQVRRLVTWIVPKRPTKNTRNPPKSNKETPRNDDQNSDKEEHLQERKTATEHLQEKKRAKDGEDFQEKKSLLKKNQPSLAWILAKKLSR